MSQISPPIRILLVCAVAFLAAWMLFLRPSAETTPPADPAAVTGTPAAKDPGAATESGAGAAVQSATAAAETAGDAAAARAGETAPPATGTAPTAGTAAKTGAGAVPALDPKAVAKLPRDVRRALEQRKVLVVGVLSLLSKPWRPMPDDDRFVRRSLSRANRYGGNVVVRTISTGRLARYDAVLKGLDLSQTPSVVVVDRERKAVVLEGYVDRISINQAIADARRTSIETRIKDPYLQRVNVLCGRLGLRGARISFPTVRQRPARWFARQQRLATSYRRQFAAVPARGAWKPLRDDVVGALRTQERHLGQLAAAVKAQNWTRALGVVREARASERALVGLDERLDRAGVTSCVGNRRT
jgi:hypothetical protein